MGDERMRGSSELWRARARTGVPFGLAMGIFGYLQDHSWWRASISAVLAGAFFGGLMGRWLVRQRQQASQATGVPDGRWTRSQLRAGMRRPAAATPELRDDLRRLLRYRLSTAEAGRRRALLTFTAVGLLSLGLALLSSSWWWLAVAFWVLMLTVTLTESSRLRRRLALLGDTAAATENSGPAPTG